MSQERDEARRQVKKGIIRHGNDEAISQGDNRIMSQEKDRSKEIWKEVGMTK